jgi:hypothetical protein
MTVSPLVTEKPALGMATLNEKALALIRWQPRQWQTIVSSGCASILNRIWPQRHPPTRGKHKAVIMFSFCYDLDQ